MMSNKYSVIIVFLFSWFFSVAYATEVTETLYSDYGDKVTVRYNITCRNETLYLTFSDVKKQLGNVHGNKFQESERVKIVFFDKNGGFVDNKFSSDIETDAVAIASDEIVYRWSEEGFVWMDNGLELQLKLLVPKATLSIPIYLAYSKKPHLHSVFAYCGVLDIPLIKSGSVDSYASAAINEKVIMESDTEEGGQQTVLTDDELALRIVDKINELLGYCSDIALPEGLDTYVGQLRQLELTISEQNVKRKVARVLREVEDKKEEVARVTSDMKRVEEENAARKVVETEAQQNLKYLNERLDNIEKLTENDVAELKTTANELRRQSHAVENDKLANQMRKAVDRCDDEVKKIDDAKKKRKLWMIIGGVILSVLMAIGNHTLQLFRNMRSQKGIEDMQDKMVRRAEYEAKRRAQNMVRSKVNKVENAARQKSQELVRNGVKNGVNKMKGKGNKSFTI